MAKAQKMNVDAKVDLSKFVDSANVSAWAQDAMSWAIAEGLIQGTSETSLSPQGDATRAQIAVIIMRFEAFIKKK